MIELSYGGTRLKYNLSTECKVVSDTLSRGVCFFLNSILESKPIVSLTLTAFNLITSLFFHKEIRHGFHSISV